MNLIIVSQDRENIVKFNSNIGLHYRDKKKIVANYIDLGNGDYYELLGEYETKERAKEILKELITLLNPKFVLNKYDTSIKIKDLTYIVNPKYENVETLDTYVYEMPEK